MQTPNVVATLLFAMYFVNDTTLTRFARDYLGPFEGELGAHATYLYMTFAGLSGRRRFFDLIFSITTTQDWNFNWGGKSKACKLSDVTKPKQLEAYAKNTFLQSGIYLSNAFASQGVLERLGEVILTLSDQNAGFHHTMLIDLTRTLSDDQMLALMYYLSEKQSFDKLFLQSTLLNMAFAFSQLRRSRLLVKWMQLAKVRWGTAAFSMHKPSTPFTLTGLRRTSDLGELRKFTEGFNHCISGLFDAFLRDNAPEMFKIIQKVSKVPFNEATCTGTIDDEQRLGTLLPVLLADGPKLESMANVAELPCFPLLVSGEAYQVVVGILAGMADQGVFITPFGIDVMARLATNADDLMFLFDQLIGPHLSSLANAPTKRASLMEEGSGRRRRKKKRRKPEVLAKRQEKHTASLKLAICDNLPVHLRRLHVPEETVADVAHSIHKMCIVEGRKRRENRIINYVAVINRF